MSKIPTAEDFLQDSFTISHFYNDKYDKMMCFSDDVRKAMIEFAKYHVEQALKAVIEAPIEYYDEGGYQGIDENAILKAYSLENIK